MLSDSALLLLGVSGSGADEGGGVGMPVILGEVQAYMSGVHPRVCLCVYLITPWQWAALRKHTQ